MDKDLLLTDLAILLMVDKKLLVDSIYLNDELYWDSLSLISTVAAIYQRYGVNVHGVELMRCETIGDIFSLIENIKQSACA
ncbi:phosphopantetheine-binding protein [Legionella lytica]|uniref:Phosphopantetheine-binding protein n=1 Tax=Legionella lytica TaxID=96232 RepID=A0ABW8D581_9GAMM